MRFFLGIQVKQSQGKIFISQKKYDANLLKEFNMSECKLVAFSMAANEKLQQNDGAAKMDSKISEALLDP